MDVIKISYRRTFNLGNYENETIEMTADLEHGEDVSKAFEKLKVMVYSYSVNSPETEMSPIKF